MWRCFYADRRLRRRDAIFSTYVEVFPIRHLRAILLLYFLHVCGGVSYFLFSVCSMLRFSPRMWRCFSCAYVARYVTKIFSTYVEVFLLFRKLSGVSIIFSTYVEVFLINAPVRQSLKHFLHVCGGVSGAAVSRITYAKFSPRMWRCFQMAQTKVAVRAIFSTLWRCFRTLICSTLRLKIFSTYVGVFPGESVGL